MFLKENIQLRKCNDNLDTDRHGRQHGTELRILACSWNPVAPFPGLASPHELLLLTILVLWDNELGLKQHILVSKNHSLSFARGTSRGIHWTMWLPTLKSFTGFCLTSKKNPPKTARLHFFVPKAPGECLQLIYHAFSSFNSTLRKYKMASCFPKAPCSFYLRAFAHATVLLGTLPPVNSGLAFSNVHPGAFSHLPRWGSSHIIYIAQGYFLRALYLIKSKYLVGKISEHQG